ncbi:MAG: IS66 family transposase, partial [Planctomycetia bacterium]
AVFNGHLKLKIGEGGFTEIRHRLAGVLKPWFERIHDEYLNAAVLHADETGWRNDGRLCWLRRFARGDSTYHLIHPKRGRKAPRVFFTEAFAEAFAGVLVTDFWKAYDVVTDRRRKRRPHLPRFLEVEGVPSSNNKAEREIRPAVLMRKASYGSAKGADNRSVLMSIHRTLKQRGRDPLDGCSRILKRPDPLARSHLSSIVGAGRDRPLSDPPTTVILYNL